jgi:hypothetical protein
VQVRSAGPGSKGRRLYQWAYLHLDESAPERGQRYLLIRRSIGSGGEPAYYRCWTPTPVGLADLVAVAGARWRVEESFQAGKGLTGLDEPQVRRYTSWARWTVLAMLANAFLAVLAAEQHDTGRHRRDPADLPGDSPPARHDALRTRPPERSPLGLVHLATTTPTPRPHLPLPATSHSNGMKIPAHGLTRASNPHRLGSGAGWRW